MEFNIKLNNMSAINYVTIDRVFSKLGRDLKNTNLDETDVIEWIGEALEFLEVPQILEEDVAFLKVKNNHAEMPKNLHMISQIAMYSGEFSQNNNLFSDAAKYRNPDEVFNEDSCEGMLSDVSTPEFLDLHWSYHIWTTSEVYQNNYTPVRLATSTFFNSIVCKEKDLSIYNNCKAEYTIVGNTEKRLRFNFDEGEVAVSYLKNSVDKETGYPLVPDNISYITAIVYYIKWKIAEMYEWAGREGWSGKADKSEAKWLKYVKQAKNYMKMPKTLDDYQNLLEQTHYLIPNHNKYYGFFGNLNKRENLQFNNRR
jgi:hypothetical protein